MKQRHTLVCALSVLALIGGAEADENVSLVHSEIGAIPPRELLSSHILELPAGEQSAWVHGAVSATAQTIAAQDVGRAQCIVDWYFSMNGAVLIDEALRTHPDARASAVIYAASFSVCEET